jgi:hypothetical protein
MRATLLLSLLCSLSAGAQAQLTYLGQTAGGSVAQTGGAQVDLLLHSFVLYGDSIALGLCSATPPYLALSALLPGYFAATQAQSGTTTAQIAAHYVDTRDTACGGERCGTYVFQGGVNDCKNGECTPATMLAATLAAVDDARALGRRVIWVNVAPFATCSFCGAPVAGWALAKEYNALVLAACAARTDVTCLDVGAGSAWEEASADGHLKTAWSCDGIHWLQGGTDALAAALRLAFPP